VRPDLAQQLLEWLQVGYAVLTPEGGVVAIGGLWLTPDEVAVILPELSKRRTDSHDPGDEDRG
jgi:hypothetical protein